MKKTNFNITGERGAWISECKLYRYGLWRIWECQRRLVNFIALNPSTADASLDDPTIKRCIGFAKAWGYGGFIMTNLFAYRATNPKKLKGPFNPAGVDNGKAIKVAVAASDCVVLCWGNNGDMFDGGYQMRRELRIAGVQTWHLGLTQSNYPKHPLYLRGDTVPVEFERAI